MIEFPKSTELNRRIPKDKLYSQFSVSLDIKRIFVEQIRSIHWSNKISSATSNLRDGKDVEEIAVFRIKLSGKNLDLKALQVIDRGIPYHILFILEHEGEVQLYMGYKERKGQDSYKVDRYYSTGWIKEERASLRLEGSDIDSVYEGFIKQITGAKLEAGSEGDLKHAIEKAEQKERLKKKISSLESKIGKEKQLNRQIKLNSELKSLRKELEGLIDG